MTVPTTEQLTRLRQRPHRTSLHLSVYEPNTVLAARLNMPSYSRGDRVLTITNLGGDPWSVVRGMTVYIGTTPNGREFGRIRAISATPTTLTIAENDLNLRDGFYLTVVFYYEPWSIFPRIVLDDDNIPSFFKDYDIAYTDQNVAMDPIPNMGPNHAAFLETTPSGSFASVWYTASGSYDPSDNSTPTGYGWVFEGGSPTGSSVLDPGYIDYTGAGHFLTSLEVLSDQGKSFTGRRHISIYTRPDQGPNRPIIAWGMSSFEGSRENGGYSVRLWLRERVDFQKVAPGALVVIFSEDAEGIFEQKIGGNAENRTSILFNGYIEDESISINPVTSRLEFRVTSITATMKRLSSFSATLENVETAATWNETQDLVVDKAMAHYLRWHSTILTIADFSRTGDTKNVQFMDFERSTVFEAVNNLYATALVGNITADRQGKIWAEINTNVVPTGTSRSLDTAISITRQDWRGALDIQHMPDDRLAFLEMGGIAYPGLGTGTIEPFLGGAPGDAPSYFGSLERITGLVVTGQTQLNELVGLAWAKANSDFPEVIVPMAGDYRILDIAPQERVLLTLEEDDSFRAIVWEEKPFITNAIRYQYLPESQAVQMEATMGEETDGSPGESIEIPVDPPYDDWTLPEWDMDFPPILPPEPWVPPVEPPPGDGNIAYMVHYNSLARTTNFWSEEDPNWEAVGVTGTVGSYRGFRLDPFDPLNSAMLLTYVLGEGPHIFHTTNLTAAQPAWVEVWGTAESTTHLGASVQRKGYEMAPSFKDSGVWYMICSTKELGGGTATAVLVKTLNSGASWAKSVGGFPPDNALDGCVTPSPYHDTIWVVAGGGPPAVTAHHFRSTNGGLLFSQKLNFLTNVGPIFLLEDDTNPNRAVIGQNGGLRITNNGGGSYSDFRPVDGVGSWGITQSEFQQQKRVFVSHPANKFMYATLQTGGLYAFFARAGVGGTWEKRHTFIGPVSGMLGYNITNPLQFYVKGSINDFFIMGSNDGGGTWVDKNGDFEAQVMVFTDLSTTVGFQVVWTA